MKKFKKIIKRTLLVILIIVPVAALAHYLVFPQQTRCILVGFSSFKKDGTLYYNEATPKSRLDSVKLLIEQATVRVSDFWGDKKASPTFIYCYTATDFERYSQAPAAPAITQLKLGAYIVLSADGADPDIIAHEITHAELYERVGFYKWTFVLPPWFRHGLAMQNDFRSYYSEDTLKARSDNFATLPDIQKFKSDDEFYAGTTEEVMLNYMTAKYLVRRWYTKEKLAQLLKDINAGKGFDEAFGR